MRELIQKWRTLSAELENKKREHKDVVGSVSVQDGELNQAKQEWELEKEKLRSTINAVLSDVTSKKSELQSIENDTAELRRKVEERRRRNEEHLMVLNKRKKLVAEQLKAAELRDEGVKERFTAFEASREETRRQILSAIKKVEEAGPQESAEYEQKVRLLRNTIKETEATLEAEAKSWALEQAMKEFNEKSDARKWLLEEISAAEGGKDLWADLLQEANTLSVNDSLQSLQELRSIISA